MIKLGKEIKKEISDIKFYIYLFVALFLAIFTLFNAYIFWPRSAEEPVYQIKTQEVPIKEDTVALSTKIEKTPYFIYKDLVKNLYKTELAEVNPTQDILKLNNTEYTINVIPDRYDKDLLKQQIMNILGSDPEHYGVYFYDLDRDIEIGINDDVIFPPMSISKLPIAVLMLREVDKGNFSLDQQEVFDWGSTADPTNVLKTNYVGTSFAIRDYLRFLIIDSDNASIRKLENLMGGYLATNEKAKNELGVTHFFRDPHDVIAKDIGRVFRGIYDGSYLSKETNEYMLYLLQNTHFSLQDGIPVGVPEPYKSQIAHKTGQGSSNPGFIWEDAGIIFGEHSDYVLVIVNDFIDIPTARYKIQQISGLIWDTTQEI
ncbi:serine hydrolase [Candidatus Dojkabacteria bacterium]|uniref:Serine hydrolase n=1 Tax=Candidatus Dojkabacteria bacterium TaxID=2099670 RepID=A0A955RLG9_9BACT|nr:serine hydrolase [Candidatus Dojkabacteria bacterium]